MLFPRWSHRLLLVIAAAFLLLRFVHLSADYPRNIRWDDGIATDEGWYASGAVDQQMWGKPLMVGDMNIGVLMPVWPVIAEVAFRVGGYGAVSIRAAAVLFFFVCVGLSCLILRRYGAREWIPLLMLALAVNPWGFAFSRSAFLEFPMVALVLAAALLIPRATDEGDDGVDFRRLVAAGICVAVAMLLKTTALVLLPALFYVVLEGVGFRWRAAFGRSLVLLVVAAAVYGPYWYLVIRTHPQDVAFYISVVPNAMHWKGLRFVADASRPFRYGMGSDRLLFALSLMVIPWSLLWRKARILWRDPLFALAAVWEISFLGFMVKHNNDPARYFAVTLPMLVMLVIAVLRHPEVSGRKVRGVLFALLALDLVGNTVTVSAAMLHPSYSFRDASTAVAAIVNAEPGHSTAVIGDDMHEVSLQSGLRPVNLLFHSGTITEQMQRYQPGWWLQFSPVDDGRCFREVLGQAYRAEPRGEWTIFYPGQQLILWKLSPIPGASLPATLTPEQAAACLPPVYN